MNVPTELTRKEWGFRQRDFSGRKKNIRFLNSGQIMIDRSSSYSLRGYMPRRLLFRVNVISGVKNRKCMFIFERIPQTYSETVNTRNIFFYVDGYFPVDTRKSGRRKRKNGSG